MNRFDLLCLGGAAVDWVLRVPRLPHPDEKLVTAFAGRFPGGLVANTACAAARLGLRVAWSGVLGDDEGGRLLLRSFDNFEVDIETLEVIPGLLSDFTVILLEPEGRRTILLVSSGHALPSLGGRVPDLIAETRLVYTVPWSMDWLRELAGLCRRLDVPLVLDVEAAGIESLERDVEILSRVAILFCSQASLKAVNEYPEDEAIDVWLRQGVGQVVMTQGAAGAWAFTPDGCWHFPAFSVPVVDTTGAGDCFHAAYLMAWLEGRPPHEALRFASAAAALAVQHLGAREGLPTREDVWAFLEAESGT